ncbi:bark storage protein A [Diospyros lotus]|uniref:bark storage protein A n=1 Tax=Diospyros lotus TaxID=55363 RepID=UPI00224FC5C0|nr:bark storage protein A [Diospyros lotus]
MGMIMFVGFVALLMGFGCRSSSAHGGVSESEMRKIIGINSEGPYLGIVAPNAFELNPLLQSPSFVPDSHLPYLDFAGRRFRLGQVGEQKVIVVMTGLGMVNAGIATQLLISLFQLKAVLHYGISGNANPNLQIGDVTIARSWAHAGLWNWQRFGDGPNDELALESSGDYTRKIGYLKFSDYNNGTGKEQEDVDNLLNSVWFQPEEIFPVNGTPEVRQHAFWVPADQHYFSLAQALKGLELESCVNSTCLPRKPIVERVKRAMSANIFVDNQSYRDFLYSKFNTTSVDMESAAVALICRQQETPFLIIRALSDLAGGGSSVSNEASTFTTLASQNSVTVLIKFINLLS